jgi:hypothetical protein
MSLKLLKSCACTTDPLFGLPGPWRKSIAKLLIYTGTCRNGGNVHAKLRFSAQQEAEILSSGVL